MKGTVCNSGPVMLLFFIQCACVCVCVRAESRAVPPTRQIRKPHSWLHLLVQGPAFSHWFPSRTFRKCCFEGGPQIIFCPERSRDDPGGEDTLILLFPFIINPKDCRTVELTSPTPKTTKICYKQMLK